MANDDIERNGVQNRGIENDVNTSSAKYLPEPSEETSLLASNNKKDNYQSTDISAGDSSSTEGETPKLRSPVGIIALLLIGVLISNADSMLVIATYGSIASEFHALKDAAWLTTSFALAGSSIQPLTGKLSDIYGRKSILLAAYLLFTFGCLICGIAQSMPQMILGRVLSGFGASAMSVLVSVIITDLVPLIQVASWRSFVNVVATLGRSVGGPIGGLLADTIGWRWSFLGQGPFLIFATLLVAMKLPGFAVAAADRQNTKGHPSKLRRIDFIGAVLLASAIAALLGSLSIGGQSLPWAHPAVVGLLIGSVVLLAVFVIYEEKYAFEPIFSPRLVVQRDVATSYSIQALQTAAQVGMMYSVPLYFRVTQFTSNTVAGAHLFPAVIGNTFGALITAYRIQKTGHYRNLFILASLISSSSYLLLIMRWKGKTSWLESMYIVPGGFATGMVQMLTMISLMAGVEKETIAVVTGGLYLCGGLGMVLGVAGVSSVQLGTLRPLLEISLEGFANGKHILEEVISDVASIEGLEHAVREVVVQAYVKSLEYSHMLSLGCTLLALVMSFTVREHPLK